MHLGKYNREYPEAWSIVDRLRADRGRSLPWWPEWCFLPLSGAYAIVFQKYRIDPLPIEALGDVGAVGALAAWRVTKGIYRFDPDVYQEIIATPVTGDIPHEILFELPEWCVYIETPGMMAEHEQKVMGFFAHLEYDVKEERKELRLLLDVDGPKGPLLVPYPLHLGSWSLDESINRMEAKARENVAKAYGSGVEPSESDMVSHADIRAFCEPLLSLLLYLCSSNGEIGDSGRRPANPRPVKTKRGPRTFSAAQVITWDVGVRMGAAIRRGRMTPAREPYEGEPTGRMVRSHIRRAHWHGYWTGPKKEPEKRKFKLLWLHPILVGGIADGPGVVHMVQ
jgi:hypothetical protein